MEKRPDRSDVELAQDRPVFVPATDIFEREDAVMVVCDVPGVDEKNVDVSLENDVLTITLPKAKRASPRRRSITVRADGRVRRARL